MQTCLCDITLIFIVVHGNDLLYVYMLLLHVLVYFSVSADISQWRYHYVGRAFYILHKVFSGIFCMLIVNVLR